MNQSVETHLIFDAIKGEVLSLIPDARRLILDSIAVPGSYLNETTETILYINTFFESLENSLKGVSTWNEFGESLHEHSWYAYDGSTIHGPSSNKKINACISELLGYIFYHQVYFGIICRHKDRAIQEIFRQGRFDIACILTDDDLKKVSMNFDKFPSLDLMKNFTRLRRSFGTTNEFSSFLFYDLYHKRIFKLDRHCMPIIDWAKSQINFLTPKLRLKNRAQKEKLRTYFLNQMERNALCISDLDKFLAIKFYVDTPKLSPQEFTIELGSEVAASELIRSLYSELKTLNTFNTKRDIQKWIFSLFIDFEGEGFSFHNVKKATENSVS